MKRLLFIIITTIIGLSACKEDDAKPNQEAAVILDIHISSESKAVPSAKVTLYSSKEDALAKINSISSKIADSNGDVEFKVPLGKTYYWFAEKGCKTNILTIEYCKAEAQGKYISGTATLEGTGTVNFISTSSTAYRVEVDRGAFYTYSFIVEAGKTKVIENFLSGEHTLTVAEPHQNISWGDWTRSFTSECGGTTSINIPY